MTLRYKLRTLLILLAILPPLLWIGWTTYPAWKAEQSAAAGDGNTANSCAAGSVIGLPAKPAVNTRPPPDSAPELPRE
ncbi:MAG TPA: hypothetical protein VFB80_19510 [Pirellulaceae bacterium]|nr:hypothetical protein [Pirellulaceae bacterium]